MIFNFIKLFCLCMIIVPIYSWGNLYFKAIDYLNYDPDKARNLFFRYYRDHPSSYRAPYALYYYVRLISDLKKVKYFLNFIVSKYHNFSLLDEVLDNLATISFLEDDYVSSYGYYYSIVRRFYKSKIRYKAYYFMCLSLTLQKKFFRVMALFLDIEKMKNFDNFYLDKIKALKIKIFYLDRSYSKMYARAIFYLKNAKSRYLKSVLFFFIAQFYKIKEKNRFFYDSYIFRCINDFPYSLVSYFVRLDDNVLLYGIDDFFFDDNLIVNKGNIADFNSYYLQFAAFNTYKRAYYKLLSLRRNKVEARIVFLQNRKKTTKQSFLYKILSRPYISYDKIFLLKKKLRFLGFSTWLIRYSSFR